MTDWSRVKWTEAGQVAAILGWPPEALAEPTAAPKAAFDQLVEQGRLNDAVGYLAQSLPRLEAVAWAARCVRDLRGEKAGGSEARALRAALLWVQDPTEERRRAAEVAAEQADKMTPESMAAMAAFFSGGSIAPAHCESLPPPKQVTGIYAAGAILVAASYAPKIDEALRTCLEAGSRMASEGLRAE